MHGQPVPKTDVTRRCDARDCYDCSWDPRNGINGILVTMGSSGAPWAIWDPYGIHGDLREVLPVIVPAGGEDRWEDLSSM